MAVTGSGTFTVSGAGNTFSLTQDGSISNDTTLALRDGASTTVDGVLSLGALAGDGTVDLDGECLSCTTLPPSSPAIFRNTGTIQMNGTGSQTLVGPGSADVNLGITQGTLVLRGNGVTYGHVVVGNVGTLSLVSDNGVPHLHTTKDFFMGDGSTLDIHMNVTSSSELGAAVSSAGTVHVGDASINLYNGASSSFNAEKPYTGLRPDGRERRNDRPRWEAATSSRPASCPCSTICVWKPRAATSSSWATNVRTVPILPLPPRTTPSREASC